ncbi:MAG: hypothetical protein LBC88_04255 [Spirochaetaceae bacterium]|jgi:hypothetical protein|nr:hypothetical protein [Spirochaetaceae bacterium]
MEKKKRVLAAVILLGIPLLAAGTVLAVFFSRAPIVVITDEAFDIAYGARRIRFARLKTALAFFRPVKNVNIISGLESEVAVFAINTAAPYPYCVFFPWSFYRESRNYLEDRPDIPVGVFTGRMDVEAQSGDPVFFQTDIQTDIYRAGRAAALLAGGGEVLFMVDDNTTADLQAIFEAALRAGGHAGAVHYTASDQVPDGGGAYAAAVILRPPGLLATPGVLFSWVNPAYTPDNVKVIFDDSPWAQVRVAASRLFSGDADKKIPSEIRVLRRRLTIKGLKKQLEALSKLNFGAGPV